MVTWRLDDVLFLARWKNLFGTLTSAGVVVFECGI